MEDAVTAVGMIENITTLDSILSSNITNNSEMITTVKPGLAAPLVTLEFIGYFVQPLILILGLVGNTFNIIIMNTKQFSHVTSRYFLTALSISDTTTLLTQIFNREFMIDIFGYDARSLSGIGCKIFWFVFRTAKMVSSWFVVFICIDRFIAVQFPLKAKMISTKRTAMVEIAMAIVVNGGLNSYWSYASKIVDGRCHPDAYDKSNPDDVELFRGLLTTGSSLAFLAPMTIMAILTPLIIYQLHKQSKARKSMSSMKTKTNNSRETKITFMLIGITIAFFILVTPGVLLHNIAFYMGVNAFGENIVSFLLYKEIAQILEQVNYAINFFLYILTSSQFRRGFVNLIKCNISGSTPSTSSRGKSLSASNSKRKLSRECSEQTTVSDHK